MEVAYNNTHYVMFYLMFKTTIQNMIFSVTYCNLFFNQVKMLMLYSVQTTILTMIGKKMRCIVDNYSIA